MSRMKTWKEIERAREIRLWVKEIVTPMVVGTTVAMSVPEVREFVVQKYQAGKDKLKTLFKKKEK